MGGFNCKSSYYDISLALFEYDDVGNYEEIEHGIPY